MNGRGAFLRRRMYAWAPRSESFLDAAASIGDVSGGDIILNVQHDRGRALARTGGGGLSFTDTPASLTLRATLPRTGEANDALTNIRARVLRGLSMEFVPKRERFENSVRIVDEAVLVGIGLVDRPQYGDSTVAARAWTTHQARDERLTL